MKILLSRYNHEHYVWKDATYKDKLFYVDDKSFKESQIVSVMDFDVSNKIQCSICGKEFIKDSPEWQQHITQTFDINRCANCRHVKEMNVLHQPKVCKQLDYGKFDIAHQYVSELKCGRTSWYSPDSILSNNAKTQCIYNQCVKAKPIELSNFFTQYPGAFDSMITIDQIVKGKYAKIYNNYDGTISIKLKSKNQIYAHINNKNIVEYFEVYYRKNHWRVFYSKKYKKFFTMNSDNYVEWISYLYDIPEAAREYIKQKIAALYE